MFFESRIVGETNTTAATQASNVNMRELSGEANPGMTILNDQSRVADLLIEDLCGGHWLGSTVKIAIRIIN